MIHNSGLYGQNEVPINMGATGNLPRINAPINMTNNLGKYGNPVGNSTNTNYEQVDYNLGHRTSQYSPYPNPTAPFNNTDFTPQFQPSINSNNIQHPTFPLNNQLHIDYTPYPITKAYKKYHNAENSFENSEIHKSSLQSFENPEEDIYRVNSYPTELCRPHSTSLSENAPQTQFLKTRLKMDRPVSVSQVSDVNNCNNTENFSNSPDPKPISLKICKRKGSQETYEVKQVTNEHSSLDKEITSSDLIKMEEYSDKDVDDNKNKCNINFASISNREIVDVKYLDAFLKDTNGTPKLDIELNNIKVLGYDDAVDILKNGNVFFFL